MHHPTDHLDRFQPVALLLGAALPGLGHIYLGFRARGLWIAAGVLGLFFTGLFAGGLDTVDSQEDRIWFIGQALVGPVAFGADYVHQHNFKGRDPRDTSKLRSADPDETLVRAAPGSGLPPGALVIVKGGPPPITKSVGRANEIGTLFSAIAGMLNLIVLIDAAFSCTKRDHDEFLRETAEQQATRDRLAAQAASASAKPAPAPAAPPVPEART